MIRNKIEEEEELPEEDSRIRTRGDGEIEFRVFEELR